MCTTQMEKYYIDSTYITVPREGVEVNTPLRDGLGEEAVRYSGTSLIWTTFGLEKVSLLERCPHFRKCTYVCMNCILGGKGVLI